MTALKTSPGSSKTKAATIYIAKQSADQRALLERLHAIVIEAIPNATTTIKWGVPFYQVNGKNVCVLSRGYRGANEHGAAVVSTSKGVELTPQEAGDEAHLGVDDLPRTFELRERLDQRVRDLDDGLVGAPAGRTAPSQSGEQRGLPREGESDEPDVTENPWTPPSAALNV